MMYSRKRYVYKQKGRGGYSNGNNPNQEGGNYYQNGENPNQEGGLVNLRRKRGGQYGGARTKGGLKRQNAADALLALAAGTPLGRPGTSGKTRSINNMLNNVFNNSIERSPLQACTPNYNSLISKDGSPIGDFSPLSPVSSPDYTLADLEPTPAPVRKRTAGSRKRKRKRTDIDKENLLMVKQFKIANPKTSVSNLHAFTGGWKLHGNKPGEERKGYRAACLRMGALIGEKMYSNPNSTWMDKMRNGEPFDLLQEYNKLKERKDSPMASSTSAAAAVANAVANAVTTKSRPKRKKIYKS